MYYFYHNTTARFNAYFNADFKQTERAKEIRNNLVDRYDSIIPVFPFGTDADAKASFQIMDDCIKKAGGVIQKHEKSKWVDECYLVIGKGYFYKKQYFEAIDNFQYVYSKFKDQPTGALSLIWAANAYLGANQSSSALSALETAKTLKSLTEKQKPFLQATYCAYYVKEGHYDEAAKALEKCFKYRLTKYEKSRYNFLMGQLLMLSNKNAKAKNHFEASLKGNPPYDLEFNAKLNLIRLYEKGNDSEVKRLLNKMLKEQKNKSNFDQLYFELAQIDYKQKKFVPSLGNYQKAAWTATVNLSIKGKSYLKAAEIYFNQPDYEMAQLYYDSATAFLPKTHPDYESAKGRKESLSDVVKLLKIIHEGDSMIRLSALDSNQLRKQIEKSLDQELALAKKKAEEAKKNTGKENANNALNGSNPNGNSSWIFDNPSAKSLGYSEFKRIWGDRPNEDDWRRSKKDLVNNSNSLPTKIDSTPINAPKLTEAQKLKIERDQQIAYRMSVIPKNQQSVDSIMKEVIESYFSLGMIYRDRMKEPKESIKSFESLITKYPQNKYLKESWFNLYQLYADVPNATKANYYKGLLMQDSTSKYALLLSGKPIPEVENLEKKQEKLYQKIYAEFVAGNHHEVIKQCNQALADSTHPNYTPRFELLKGLALFKNQQPTEAETVVAHVGKTYINHPVKPYADEILKLIQNSKAPSVLDTSSKTNTPNTAIKNATIADTSLFKNTFEDVHFVILAADMGQIGYIDLKLDIRLAQFNDAKFGLDGLQVTSTVVANVYQAFIVRTFKDRDKAQYYAGVAQSDPEILMGAQSGKNKIFAISKNNFTTLLKTGKLTEYLEYYQAFYLEQ